MKLALDAGHYKNTPGKRTPNGLNEWYMNDRVLRAFENQILKYKGVSTVRLDDATGNKETTLTYRTDKAKDAKADMLISFHHNAYQSKWGDHGGSEAWIYKGRKSEKLAETLLASIVKSLGLRNRGVKYGNMHVTREVPFPAVLLEIGFMDSRTDHDIIVDPVKSELVGKNMAIDFAKAYGLSLKEDKPSFKSYSFNIPKGSTLYNAKGKAYPAKTTQAHKVTIIKENGDLGNFKASWLKGVDNAWVKVVKDKPKFKEYKHTIPSGSTLYNANGSAYRAKTTQKHTVTILEEKNGLGRFKASWLKGVSEAWVKLKTKSNTPSIVRLGGKTRLFVNATGSATYPVPSKNKYTTLQQRSVSVLKEQGNRYQVRIPTFNPEVLWISKDEVR